MFPEGQVFYGVSGADQETAFGNQVLVSFERARQLFKTFIRTFTDTGNEEANPNELARIGDTDANYKYRDQIQQNISDQKRFLKLHLQDVEHSKEFYELGEAIREQPLQYIPVLEEALDELFEEFQHLNEKERTRAKDPRPKSSVQLQIVTNEDAVRIRELQADDIEKLVCVPGIVIKANQVSHQARKMILECSNCGDRRPWELKLGMSRNLIPRGCQSRREDIRSGELEACPPDPYRVVADLCSYWDIQQLRFQELPENVPTGEMPRHINVKVNRVLCDSISPGARVTLCGIYSTYDKDDSSLTNRDKKGGVSVKHSYIHLLGLMYNSHTKGHFTMSRITPSEEERFQQLSKIPNIRQLIYDSIAPAIASDLGGDVLGQIKKAVACLLFSGSRKELPDLTRLRGDINILLLGDPSTAKSQFLKFVENCAPIGVYTSGKGSSAAGLTASIVRDSSHGNFSVEGGAMVLADGGVVCIDEFDKMRPDDQVAIHEAMEQQTISIAKAGITATLNSRCSVLAAANPSFGAYDDLLETADQMEFASTILSRFDLIFLVRDVRNLSRDRNMAEHIINLHVGQDSTSERKVPIALNELRSYINYCRRKCQPRISEAVARRLENFYVSTRKQVAEEKRKGKVQTVPITVRQLESLVRITESLAKMELKDEADEVHFEEAQRLFTVSTLDAANHNSVTGDRMNEENRGLVLEAENQIRARIPHQSRLNRHVLQKEFERAGVDSKHFIQALRIMELRGEIQVRSDFTIVRIV